MTSRPLVVMLGHQAHVGKDLLGSFLVNQDNFQRFGFADKLKSVVADLYGFTDEHMYGSLKNVIDERYNTTPREILQDFGQEQRQRFPNIWADYVFRQIEDQFNPNDNVHSLTEHSYVITDFRFPNEYIVAKEYAKRNDWDIVTVKIIRPDEDRGDVAGSTNISETALNGFSFDYEIYNTKTKEVLYDRFKRVVLKESASSKPAQTITVDMSFMEK